VVDRWTTQLLERGSGGSFVRLHSSLRGSELEQDRSQPLDAAHRRRPKAADANDVEALATHARQVGDENDLRSLRASLSFRDLNDERILSIHREIVVERRNDDRLERIEHVRLKDGKVLANVGSAKTETPANYEHITTLRVSHEAARERQRSPDRARDALECATPTQDAGTALAPRDRAP